MSALEEVLARRVPPGTYRWVGAGADEDEAVWRAQVEAAGWRFARLDAAALRTRAELLDALGPALGLVGYHGRNLDALEECVRDLEQPTVLVWDGGEELARAEPRTVRVVRTILVGDQDAPGTWVLLRGAAEDPGAPDVAPTLG